MKRVSFVLSFTLASGLVASGIAPAQAASPPAHRATGTSQRLHPQKIRLARRPHAALRHEFGAASARLPHVRVLVQRLPHRHGTRAATYSLDELSHSSNVIASGPGEAGYTQVDSAGGTVHLWTDPQGRVKYTISGR
jgi:hypothetical protein